jgi:hypothetical protein
LAQLTENFPKGDRWLQISLPLLEELGRNGTILSSYSYGKCGQQADPTLRPTNWLRRFQSSAF